QFRFVEIGDDAIAQSTRIAVDDRIAAMFLQIRFSDVRRGPDEDIDEMFVAPIDERGNCATVQIIQSPADEWKTLRGEILHLRRKVQFPVEPRLDGVLVAG